jgi:hypothetical protein
VIDPQDHRCRHLGGRFSANAEIPSRASSV